MAAREWVTDGKGSPLPPGHGKAEAARVNGRDPGGAGTGPGGREQCGRVRCRLQEGGPHHHCRPAGGGKYLLLNQQVVKATAMSTCTAFHSCNGSNGARNPVGEAMFSNANMTTAQTLRSTMAGEVRVRTRGMDTHVTHGLEVWNACKELRGLRSKAQANRAATRLARESPL
jgi:hypothetical protein